MENQVSVLQDAGTHSPHSRLIGDESREKSDVSFPPAVSTDEKLKHLSH